MRTIIRTTINQNVPGNRQDRLVKVAGEVRFVALEQLRLFPTRLTGVGQFSGSRGEFLGGLYRLPETGPSRRSRTHLGELSGSPSDPTRRCRHSMPVAAHASVTRG